MTKAVINQREEELAKIRGPRVTPSELTVGRWYQVYSYTHPGAYLHAQYVGTRRGKHVFDTCREDIDLYGVNLHLERTDADISSGIKPVFKFTTHPDKVAVPPAPAPLHPVDSLKADIDQLNHSAAELNAQAATLVSQANVLLAQADTKKAELANQLAGYLPEVPKSRSLYGKPPSFL